MIQPEQMSLTAHQHIQYYLNSCNQEGLSKEELTAVYRLSQHLRIFGLLSASGYINQSNTTGEIRKQTIPVWESLLGQLLNKTNPPERKQLMIRILKMVEENPAQYMNIWRRSLILSHHWNFWARAYVVEK